MVEDPMGETSFNIVILAAGGGTRLGRPFPKALTRLADGETILGRQLALLRYVFGAGVPICVVVGFKADLVLEAAASQAAFAYNEVFDQTNTAHSLHRALQVIGPGGVLWLNGDVVFDERVLAHLAPFVAQDRSFVAVNRAVVGVEEVKYRRDDEGFVRTISKDVVDSEGEAVGINYVAAGDRPPLADALARCTDHDYFERGIERATDAGVRFRAVDISAYPCVEVDFEADLRAANGIVAPSSPVLRTR
jgi:CDP-glycerol glycerophosphotransferase